MCCFLFLLSFAIITTTSTTTTNNNMRWHVVLSWGAEEAVTSVRHILTCHFTFDCPTGCRARAKSRAAQTAANSTLSHHHQHHRQPQCGGGDRSPPLVGREAQHFCALKIYHWREHYFTRTPQFRTASVPCVQPRCRLGSILLLHLPLGSCGDAHGSLTIFQRELTKAFQCIINNRTK